MIVLLLIISFAPGIFWLWMVYSRDKYQPEPRGLVIRTFIFGMLVSIPIAVVESFLYTGPDLSTVSVSMGTSAYVAFIVAGVTEEVGKFLIVRWSIFKSRQFDEPMDGIVYASAAALGFASLENLGYVFEFGWDVMLLRGPFSTLGHVIFSALWGYQLGLSKVGKRSNVTLGLLAAILVHGLFNFALFQGGAQALIALPVFICGLIILILMIKRAQKISPFKSGGKDNPAGS